ncbi:MAG: GntR family transcriptional regulator, partial [Gemmatimonadetes bacterium]|nr:GntR family transcriptional regulator [Gemmatimonadota bacterium]
MTGVTAARGRTLAAADDHRLSAAEVLEAPVAEQTSASAPTRAVMDFVSAAMGLLQNRGGGSADAPQADETVEALQTALEELQTSVEELQLMNEELHATRCMVEVEREHYRELFECVPHPYLITDGDGVVREANDAAATLLGARRSFLIGKPLAVFVPEEGRTGFRKRLRDLRSGGRMEWPLELIPRGRAPKPLVCAASAARRRESDTERIYWLFQDVPEQEPDSESTNGAGPTEAADAGVAKSQDFEELIAQATLRPGVSVVEQLRDLIAGAHDMGSLQVGQRLPSIRAIADRFGVTSYAALQAYASLEAEGVVERRERSGVYVAPVDWPVPPRLPETAEWLATVLTQACEHQVRIPHLPDLVRRWTGSVAIKCACVESSEDSLVSLTHELSNRFGLTAVPVPIGDILGPDGNPRRASALPAAVHEAQLLVTTPFHASQIRAIAESTGKPLLVATLNREMVDAVEAHLTDHDLTVVCVDRASGERLRNLQGGAYRDRIRVVLADELESAELDRTQPVFLTLAARQRLNGASLRLIAPPTPSFSLE